MTSKGGWQVQRFANSHLSLIEQEALRTAGYGGRSGLGESPVLLVVDVTAAFCGPRDTSLLEAIERYPLASGPAAWDAVPRVHDLVASARRNEIPVIFTRPRPMAPMPVRTSRWDDKNERQREAPPDASEVLPETGFTLTDPLLEKDAPSAFAGSPLLRWLVGLGCDSVIVCGGTTSGCVRATVVDAFSFNLKVTVASDACFDRVTVSHEVGLFDVDLKYGDVLSTSELITELDVRQLVPSVPLPPPSS